MVLVWDNEKTNGHYYLGFRVIWGYTGIMDTKMETHGYRRLYEVILGMIKIETTIFYGGNA